MKISNQSQVSYLQQNQGVEKAEVGNLNGSTVKKAKGFGKVARFFKVTLPNFFKGLSERKASKSSFGKSRLAMQTSPKDRKMPPHLQELTKKEARELRERNNDVNDYQVKIQMMEVVVNSDVEMDEELVIKQPPQKKNEKPPVQETKTHAEDPLGDLVQFLEDDIANDQKEKEELLKKDESIHHSLTQTNGEISHSEESLDQLRVKLGGEQKTPEVDFSELDELVEKLNSELKETREEQPVTVQVSTPHTTFLPRPMGNPFERRNVDK